MAGEARMTEEIKKIEQQLFELTAKLNELRKAVSGEKVTNYSFATLEGEISLLDMFGDKDRIFVDPQHGSGMPILHAVGRWF
jgi:predicted dithiol-disulfide oxidoreductase (DUF899 family)